MRTQPKLAQRLLQSFLSNHDLKDDVLGDFAQEWTERVTVHGARAADLWYLRQTISTVPHLVRLWLRTAGLGAVLRKSGAVLSALILSSLPIVAMHFWASMQIAIGGLFAGMMSAGTSAGGDTLPLAGPDVVALAVQAGGLGIVSAWLGAIVLTFVSRSAPMVSVALFSIGWVPTSLALSALLPSGWPTWYIAVLPAALFCSSLSGGILATVAPSVLVSRSRAPGR
jgi:hypothetical protein